MVVCAVCLLADGRFLWLVDRGKRGSRDGGEREGIGSLHDDLFS